MITTHGANTKKLKYQFHTIHSQRTMTITTQKTFILYTTTTNGAQTNKPFIPYRMIELDSYNAHSPLTYNREGITNGSERFKYLICTYIT